MSTTRGCFGKIGLKLSTTTSAAGIMGELADWSYEETAEEIDASEMGDCTKKFVAGAQKTAGSITAHWDSADAVQNLITVGATVQIEIYPGGNGSGATFYETPTGAGNGATVLSVSRAGNGVDGLVGNTFGFSVNGAMNTTSVP